MLNGKGIFSTTEELWDNGWKKAKSSTLEDYKIEVDVTSKALTLQKNEDSEFNFDDAIIFTLENSEPRHV